jgi:hypothetical protein
MDTHTHTHIHRHVYTLVRARDNVRKHRQQRDLKSLLIVFTGAKVRLVTEEETSQISIIHFFVCRFCDRIWRKSTSHMK